VLVPALLATLAWAMPAHGQAPGAKPAAAAKPKPAAAPPKPTGAPIGPDGMRVGTDLAKVGDSIVARTTWPPAGQARFVAAVRAKRLLLDVARLDLDVRKDTARARAFRATIAAHAAIPVGTAFTLTGKFGTIPTKVTGFDVWQSRVVATLELPPAVDSLARKDDKMTAVAVRAGASAAPAAAASPAAASPAAAPAAPAGKPLPPLPAVGPTCVRDSFPKEFKLREKEVRDSLEQVVKQQPRPAYTGYTKKATTRASRATGCFGVGRLALAMWLRDDRGEWFVERVVVVDDDGKVIPFKVSDLRFRAHELLGAYDVDGDGIDELATRGITERAGATTILKLDPRAKKAERLAAGFAWEDF
jgi:hypothetical protein